MITKDNKVAKRVFDALKVPKITKVVSLPNVKERNTFRDLALCGNKLADWILGFQHRNLPKTFYNFFAACKGPPVGDEVLVELFSFVLKLTTVASFSEFEEANIHPVTGANILNARALKDIYH